MRNSFSNLVFIGLPLLVVALLSSCGQTPGSPLNPDKAHEYERLEGHRLKGPVKLVSEYEYISHEDSSPRLTSISEFHKNGWLLRHETYDWQGEFQEKWEYEWNGKGYMTKEKYYKITPGHPSEITQFILDEWGRAIEIQYLSPEGEVERRTKQSFNAAHQITKRVSEESKSIFKYERDTLLIYSAFTGPDGNHSEYTFKYDEQGLNTEAIRDIHEAEMDFYVRFTQAYDNRGNQIEQAIYQGIPEKLDFRWTKEFNDQDQEILLIHRDSTDQPEYELVTLYNDAGESILEERWEYDENGEKFLEKKTDFIALRDTMEREVREEDPYGNWVRIIEYYGDSIVEVQSREFEYFEE